MVRRFAAQKSRFRFERVHKESSSHMPLFYLIGRRAREPTTSHLLFRSV
jgi:hypothetical protein